MSAPIPVSTSGAEQHEHDVQRRGASHGGEERSVLKRPDEMLDALQQFE